MVTGPYEHLVEKHLRECRSMFGAAREAIHISFSRLSFRASTADAKCTPFSAVHFASKIAAGRVVIVLATLVT